MSNIIFKKCGSDNNVKNSKQRYKCKRCGCNFIIGDKREKFLLLPSCYTVEAKQVMALSPNCFGLVQSR
jgi:hypothetical protein